MRAQRYRRKLYADACIASNYLNRDLGNDTSKVLSYAVSKLLTRAGTEFSQVSGGLSQLSEKSDKQKQAFLRLETLRSDGLLKTYSVTAGERVDGVLTLDYRLSAAVGVSVTKRPLILSATFENWDGGILLGVPRVDDIVSLSLSYSLNDKITVSLGLKTNRSTISYFDERETTFGVQLKPSHF